MKCKQASFLLSRSLDGRLRPTERIETTIHLVLCRDCRRFRRHIHFMRNACRRFAAARDVELEPELNPRSGC